MTTDEFRKMALEIPGAIEQSHMNHPDFRVEGKIFATLGAPDKNWGMVKLAPEQQRAFIEKAPRVFKPCSGAWGRQGATNIYLSGATAEIVRSALDTAAKNLASKKTSNVEHPTPNDLAATRRVGKRRCRMSAEMGRDRYLRFEIAE
jgi:hypothetical protein